MMSLEKTVVLGLFGSLFFFAVSVWGQTARGNICEGQVGDYAYSLQGLSQATGGNDVSTMDPDGNTFYYRPCNALQRQQCQTITDSTPAACEKDTRKVPQYHDCGSTTQVQWSPRNSGADTGFFIQFSGGEDDRMLDIEFICDESAGTGQLEAANPVEQPTHFYHLKWATVYACPTTNSSVVQCCAYTSGSSNPAVKSTCALASTACPFSLGTYQLYNTNKVTSCSQCGFSQPSCCFYANPNNFINIATNCVINNPCPVVYSFGQNPWKLVGTTNVDSCSDCYFG